MKRKLFVVTAMLFTACNHPSKPKQIDMASEESKTSSLIIENELETCNGIIARYQKQIDETLAGDVEAMKKLPITKTRIESELAELKKLAALFNEKQTEKFSATQEKFLAADSRIK